MVGVNKNRIGNDDIYEATAVVEGGQLVVPAGTATLPGKVGIGPAGAGATNCLGVAGRRAVPHADLTATSETDGDGYPTLQVNPVNELTVVYKGCVIEVDYTAVAVAYGVKLKTAAAGKVAAWVSGTDGAEKIVGECRVVGGMGSGGGKGFALIY
jgi:hypothetical protein